MIIDADAHVEESEAMFDRLDKELWPRRPLPVRFATDTVYGKYNAVWLIDGETYPKLVGKGAGTIGVTAQKIEGALRFDGFDGIHQRQCLLQFQYPPDKRGLPHHSLAKCDLNPLPF